MHYTPGSNTWGTRRGWVRLTQSQSVLSPFLREPRASVSGRCNSPARAALAWLPDTCRVDAASSQRQPRALLSRVGGPSSDPATGSWVQTRGRITLLAILKSDQLPIKVPNEEGLLRLSRDRQEWASAGGIEEGCLEESARRAVQGKRLGWGPRASG